MLSIGIDTHQKMHYVEVQNNEEKVMWRGQIDNNKEGFNSLLLKVKTIERSNNDNVIGIYINPTGTYHMPLQYFLENNNYGVNYVDARITNYVRKIENLGKEKSDKVDAHLLALTPWKYKESDKKPHVRNDLSELTRLLYIVKRNTTRITNTLLSDLACVFPEFITFFPDITTKTALIMLGKYTLPEDIIKAGIDEIFDIMRKTSRGHYSKNDSERFLKLAVDSIGIPDTGVYSIRIKENIKRLNSEIASINNIENKINEISNNNNDIRNINDIMGIGKVNAVTIVSEIGNIQQFNSSRNLQSYGGKAPLMEGSGGESHAVGISRIRNLYLSNAVYECSISLVNHKNREFLDIFNREIKKGKKTTQAYIIVGNRLLKHVYSILKNKKPYKQRLAVDS